MGVINLYLSINRKKHIDDLKNKMEKYVLPDKEFSGKTLSDITRGDIIDLMQRLAREPSDKIPGRDR